MNWSSKLLIIAGSIIWSLTMVKSGWNYEFGLGFWGANGHDGIWHIAISSALETGSLQLPIFASEAIKNYHLGFNFLLAAIAKVTSIPLINLYFQIIPPILAVSIGMLSYKFVRSYTKSESSAFWSVFFVYFGTSLAWIIGRHESFFWAQQSLSTLINPPYALSLVVLILIFECILNKRYVKLGLLTALIIQLKVYIGILVVFGLFVLLISEKRFLKSLILVGIFGLPVFLLFNSSSSGLITVQPFWFIDQLFAPDRLSSEYLRSAISTFKSGQMWHKLAVIYLMGLFIFIVGNFGIRLVGLFQFIKSKNHTNLNIFLSALILFGTTLPLLLIQKGTAWNTIQFIYYAQFVLNILSGITVSQFINSRKSAYLKTVLIFFIISIHVPSALDSLSHYLPSRPPAKLAQKELQALSFLNTLPRGIVLTQPFNKILADAAVNRPPRPLSLYESTAYVSAFSGQLVYLEDEVNLNILGLDWQTRRKKVEEFFSSYDPSWQQSFVNSEKINYLYITLDLPQPKSLPPNTVLFQNEQSIIYRFEN